jgi:branched-chain amino acid aminotransferase
MISSVHLDSKSVLAGIKSANRLPFILAQDEARESGKDESVLTNERGHIVELTNSNLFVVSGSRLLTPPLSDGALPGVTRRVALDLAPRLGIPVSEMEMKPSIFADITEAFATNSVREIVSISELNGRKLPSQSIALQLRAAYRDLVREECL